MAHRLQLILFFTGALYRPSMSEGDRYIPDLHVTTGVGLIHALWAEISFIAYWAQDMNHAARLQQ